MYLNNDGFKLLRGSLAEEIVLAGDKIGDIIFALDLLKRKKCVSKLKEVQNILFDVINNDI